MSVKQETTETDRNSFEPSKKQMTNRRPRFLNRGPDLDALGRMASTVDIQEALRSLEFDSSNQPFGIGDEYETDPDKILENIMNGSNEIGISLYTFFEHFKEFGAGYSTTLELAEPFRDELWKRELIMGVVTLFHPMTVAEAIRKRPDLLHDIGNWFAAFGSQYPDIITEEAPKNIEQEAERLIEDTLKFGRFLDSKLPTMTVVLGQIIYQITKNNHRDYHSASFTDKDVIGKRIVTWEAHGISADKNSEITIFATLLLMRDKVLAIGTDADINQIFDRNNLGELMVTELVSAPVAVGVNNGEAVTREPDIDTLSFDDIAPDAGSVVTRTIPLKEDLFDLITDAVRRVCANRRTVTTACVMITDKHVKFSATRRGFYELYKVGTPLIESPTLTGFTMEIELLEHQARETLEHKIFEACQVYLDLSDRDLIDSVNRKMVDLLVEGVEQKFRLKDHADLSYIWHELKMVGRRPEFFLGIALDQYNTKNELALKLTRSMR